MGANGRGKEEKGCVCVGLWNEVGRLHTQLREQTEDSTGCLISTHPERTEAVRETLI